MRKRGVFDPLAQQLRAERVRRGETQGAVAARMGLSRESLNAYEGGRHSPRLPMLRLWAGALGMDLVLQRREAPDV